MRSMRAAAILGLGTSAADLKPFQLNSRTEWQFGLPASSNDADAILVFGGDGTIHRYLSDLVRLQLPVLMVPSGSGNDFSRNFKLHSKRDSLCAWRDFESGKVQAQPIDLGVIAPCDSPEDRRYFCCVAGCGLDTVVTRSANRMPRWLRGRGGYVLALLPEFLNLQFLSMRLTCLDNEGRVSGPSEPMKRTLLAAFANTRFYGGGMCIAPRADPSDGQLDICRVSKMSPFELFSMFPRVYFGNHLSSPKVEYSRTWRVQIGTDTPTDIYADGEFVCQTPAEISIAAGVLRVIRPPS